MIGCLAVGSWLIPAAAETIDERAAAVVAEAASEQVNWDSENDYKTAPMVASASFASGRDEEARAILVRQLAARPLTAYFDPEFPLYSTMHCYLRWKDVPGKYPPQLRQQTLDYVAAAREPSSATTYNHHWMLAAGLILAYQEWGDQIGYVYKNNPADRSGRAWAIKELDRLVRFTHGEELSETYARFTYGPILTIHDFVRDPELKAKCRAALDFLAMRMAAFYFKGHSAGSTRRTYGPMRMRQGDVAPSWLYFGGPGEPARTVLPMALSSYRPPAEAQDVAWRRDEPYAQLGSRSSNGRTERLVTWFDRSYCVFSEYLAHNHVGPADTWFHERLSWAVRWEAPPLVPSTFFIKHPCPKTGNQQLGDTPFHQVLQHERAVVGVCRIPGERPKQIDPSRWRPYLLGAFPVSDTLLDESATGRLYLNYGQVMIAVAVTTPFTIEDGKQRGVREFKIPNGGHDLDLGYAVETARPTAADGADAAAQLAAFRDRTAPRFDELSLASPAGYHRVTYRNAAGVLMELEWRPTTFTQEGESSIRRLDGQPIPDINLHRAWPLLQNPFLEQACGDTTMTVHTTDGQTVSLDFSGAE